MDTQDFAGTERHLLLLVGRLRTRGIEAAIGCRDGSALQCEAIAQQIPSVPLGRRPGPTMLLTLLRHVRGQRVDLLHAHNGRTQLMSAIIGRSTGIPIFATQHFLSPMSTTYRGPKRVLANAAHQWVNRQVRRFAAVSEAARTAMLERERLPPDQIVTVPNGIEPLAPPPADRLERIRAGLGVSVGAPLVVTVARLVLEKGIADLIDAVPLVRRSVPDAVFVIVGEGALGSELRARTTQLGLDDAVRFAGFRADATDVIAAADLFVLPSPGEPFGLVLLEAMALARPVVATAAGGPLEIVDHGQTGVLARPSDPASLAAAIAPLLLDRAAAQRMGAAGLDRFERHFTASRMAQATEALYAAGMGVGTSGGRTDRA